MRGWWRCGRWRPLGQGQPQQRETTLLDGLKRRLPRTRGLRRATGERTGGQFGHPGETLRLVADPDAVEQHRPGVCVTCQAALDAEAEVVGVVERRQVYDLPRVRLRVTERQALRLRCPPASRSLTERFLLRRRAGRNMARVCGRWRSTWWNSGSAYERACELLTDVCGAPLSEGVLATWLPQGAEALEPVEEALKAALTQAAVLRHDETGVRRGGRLALAHVTCPERLTHYAINAERGSAATGAIRICRRTRA